MLAALEGGGRAWHFFTPGVEPSYDDLEIWRRWMTTVFMPRNRVLYGLVVSKADLLRGNDCPASRPDLSAHVASWEVVMSQWAAKGGQ